MKPKSTYHNQLELIQRFAKGDSDAFFIIYKQLHLPIFRFVQKWIGSTEDAEELTADIFFKLWNNRDRFETLDYIRAFLHVAAKNSCINFLKQLKVKNVRQKELDDLLYKDAEPYFILEEVQEELLKLIYGEVEQMPPKMKEIFMLSYVEGLKPSEIAVRLNLNTQTIQNQKANAIRFLKSALADKLLFSATLFWLELALHEFF
ncbi:RNA polymerase sigma factor [Terrimonas sp.]|uniref:RNA polymerase sigma factor n=1 Tax=Terrimonas sp. TaxID=1914338 RepID=UPI001401FFF3|nr:sigma-70 family RNA polymerase sigma factor [Terrimonas sp.]